jgi:uncharacterized membrane protein YphA (DoxX/SURF4 family)
MTQVISTGKKPSERLVRWARWVAIAGRIAFGLLFLWASSSKILDPLAFLSNVYQYQILPVPVAQVFAVVLPWTELLLGACLVSGFFPWGAWFTCIGMFLMFSVAHASIIVRGMEIDCGCGISTGAEHITIWTMLRSILFLGLSILGLVLARIGSPKRGADKDKPAKQPVESDRVLEEKVA